MLNATIIIESQIYVTIYDLCIKGHLIVFVLIPEKVGRGGGGWLRQGRLGIGRVTIEKSPKKVCLLIG